jgi:hypothetical protein
MYSQDPLDLRKFISALATTNSPGPVATPFKAGDPYSGVMLTFTNGQPIYGSNPTVVINVRCDLPPPPPSNPLPINVFCDSANFKWTR